MPADSDAWFDSYEDMILGYAELAERVDADALVIGTELTTMSLYPDEWRSIIDRIREVYDGNAHLRGELGRRRRVGRVLGRPRR